MDMSKQNPMNQFALSYVYPSISSSSTMDSHARDFDLSEHVSLKKHHCLTSFFQPNYQTECNTSNSFLGLLNCTTPVNVRDSTGQLGFHRFASPDLFSNSTKSFNKDQIVMENDDEIVHEYYHHYLQPANGGLQNCDRIVPFMLSERQVNDQFSASGYNHFVPDGTREVDVEGSDNACNLNDYRDEQHIIMVSNNAKNGNNPRKKKKKKMGKAEKGKRKIVARESSSDRMIKGHWSPEEDRLLLQQVERFGVGRWTKVAKYVKGREGKQCRERWFNYLRPDIKTESWTEEEDQIMMDAYEKMGSKWSVIQNLLPGRTENSIKNHWNTVKRRVENRLASAGRSSSTNTKNTRLEKFILSLIVSSHPARMPEESSRHRRRRAKKSAHNDSSDEEEHVEQFDDIDQQEDVIDPVNDQYHKLDQVKEDAVNESLNAEYYQVGLPMAPADQHLAAATSGLTMHQFGNLVDPAFLQQLDDFDMSRLLNNQEDNWKAEMEAIKMFLAKDL